MTASQQGAAHRVKGAPNQDAVAAGEREGMLAAAVADGHGHRRHFRSAAGARLAVAAAIEHLPGLACPAGSVRAAEDSILRDLVPAVSAGWRAAVHADVAAAPFTPAEDSARLPGDGPLIAYGTTLLMAAVVADWLLLAQIGDGTIVGIAPGGRAVLPVPGDPALDGHRTTSLCSPAAERQFRVGAVDLSHTPLLGVMLVTDGYGNAQAVEAWEEAVSADLAGILQAQPRDWLAGQVQLWADRCASADGSADDTTIALLLAPPGGHSGPVVPAASWPPIGEAETIP